MNKRPKTKSGRIIDAYVSQANKNIKKRFVLIPSMEIKAWKAYIIIMFVAGFSAALIWSAYNRWYTDISAKTKNRMLIDKIGNVGEKNKKNCLGEGKITFDIDMPNGKWKCCEGLTMISRGFKFNAKTGICRPTQRLGRICSNCGNSKCELWENPCNCPSDCKGPTTKRICIKEGKVVRYHSVPPERNFATCCPGLVEVDEAVQYNPITKKCELPEEGTDRICVNCGNGKCEMKENYCNCPTDCPTPSTRPTLRPNLKKKN